MCTIEHMVYRPATIASVSAPGLQDRRQNRRQGRQTVESFVLTGKAQTVFRLIQLMARAESIDKPESRQAGESQPVVRTQWCSPGGSDPHLVAAVCRGSCPPRTTARTAPSLQRRLPQPQYPLESRTRLSVTERNRGELRGVSCPALPSLPGAPASSCQCRTCRRIPRHASPWPWTGHQAQYR